VDEMSDAEAMGELEKLRNEAVEEFKRAPSSKVDAVVAKIQAIDIALGCLLRRKVKGV